MKYKCLNLAIRWFLSLRAGETSTFLAKWIPAYLLLSVYLRAIFISFSDINILFHFAYKRNINNVIYKTLKFCAIKNVAERIHLVLLHTWHSVLPPSDRKKKLPRYVREINDFLQVRDFFTTSARELNLSAWHRRGKVLNHIYIYRVFTNCRSTQVRCSSRRSYFFFLLLPILLAIYEGKLSCQTLLWETPKFNPFPLQI